MATVVRFSPQIPFLMGLVVKLEELSKTIHLDPEDEHDDEQGLDISLPVTDGIAYAVLVTLGPFDNPFRQVLIELQGYEGFEDRQAFSIEMIDAERNRQFHEAFNFLTSDNIPQGAGQVVAEIAWKYLAENVVPADDSEWPEQLEAIS